MKTKIRIFAVPIIFTFLTVVWLLWYIFTPLRVVYVHNTYEGVVKKPDRIGTILDHSSSLEINEITAKQTYLKLLLPNQVHIHGNDDNSQECNMNTCFNMSRCLNGFSVYVYKPVFSAKISPLYAKILKVVSESQYLTTDPTTACVFLPPYDTLDRDPLSTDYSHGFRYTLTSLPFWNNGMNHLVFNFFSGTFPTYSHSLSSLNLEFGRAILIKASVSDNFNRRGFDISSPLLPKDFKLTDRHPGALRVLNNLYPVQRKYLLSFKGKRYVWGVGSVARNALSNIHNNRDIVLLTTCIHGANWYKYEDRLCENDNNVYTEYEFVDLMINSSFCLVPRGRRLGSFRFLESLQFGCIPVSLSNSYVMPFSDVIDWKLTAINIDERNLFQVPAEIHSVSANQLLAMRLQAQFIWETYFSSTRKYISTILEILKDRIYSHFSRSYHQWNFPPGAIFNQMEYVYKNNNNLFTAVVNIYETVTGAKLSEKVKLVVNTFE
ncbi:Exostosin-1-like [Oopsacas minuta]|uniref:Exostosin-1-like n=1 Tax=Oopsacas minuta TaxID=111878 RepID=A0AAV7JNL1_9METZ|nr:Exostosin-1-like [Oopsacas minuta]